jgi:hypothetical protein
MLGIARYFLIISFGLFLMVLFTLLKKYRD